MLTGDPDGLASALMKLEQAQRPRWEGMVLPGGRIPDPSLLRSHPRTDERIARLMALKGVKPVAHDHQTEPRPTRSSPVPKIKPRWGRGEASRYSHYASLLDTGTIAPVPAGEAREEAASGNELAAPWGKPRVRIRRGGVYW